MPVVATAPLTRTLRIEPLEGQVNQKQASSIPNGASPDMVNCFLLQGVLRKRPGYTQYRSGNSAIGTAVVGLYSTQDEENNTHLFATHPTGLAKYNTATQSWDAMTGPALTGATSQLFSFETSQNSLVFCQGVDQVMRIPFNTTAYAILNANCPPARYLARFTDRLTIAYTVEGGATKPFRIRRSVAADHANWTGVGSGFVDVSEFPYHIRNIKKLGSQLVVYHEQAVDLGTRTGQASAPARYDVRAADVGLYADFTLVGWKDGHIFMGTDDFYEFNGGVPQELGLPVRDQIFAQINPSSLRRMFALPKFDTREYIAFLVSTGATTPDIAWVFNRAYRVWYPWTVSGPMCGCAHRLDTTTTIDQLVGTIDDQTWEFDSRTLTSQFAAMLTGHTDGKIYVWDTQYHSDNGSAINCRWTSRDFRSADIDPIFEAKKVTLKAVGIEYKDTGTSFTLDISYSVDGGTTWTNPQTVTFTTSGSTAFPCAWITQQTTGNKVRFKIEQNSATMDFQIIAFYPVLEVHDSPIYT